MIRYNRLIATYIIQTIFPYFCFSWLLLSVILFVQQASRYSDIFFNNNLPSSLIWQLTLALIPNVISFTCPMAILTGVIIGISKLQGDSELTAIRAGGISNFQITVPIFILGVLLSLFAFTVNLKGVPVAAGMVREVAAQTAIYKLESPIEPGVFNTEFQGYTIYVKDGDIENGTWNNIFIYTEDSTTSQVRLITSEKGRIDSQNGNSENSELALEKASVNTFSGVKPYKILFSEKVENLRLVIRTRRGELIERLANTQKTPEELGMRELAAYAKTKTGKERIEADILFQRRLILSITPLMFALLGASLILRFNRGGGKGFGILLALLSLIAYYLAALFGEQLARTGTIDVLTGSLFPILLTGLSIFWFFLSRRLFPVEKISKFISRLEYKKHPGEPAKISRRQRGSITTGILDFDIISGLLRYFLLTFGFLASVYILFTAFELWKFAGSMTGGINLLIRYLFYLIPFVYIQISPSALMIAMLATYVIKSRQNEVVTWTASGQSIYRLLLPCFVLMMIIGFINWEIQERVLPQTNIIQDKLRDELRSSGVMKAASGKYWVASENRIYSFELPDGVNPNKTQQFVSSLTVFQFSETEAKLKSFIKTENASWENGKIKLLGDVERTIWENDVPKTEVTSSSENEIIENYNPFKQTTIKPSHLNSRETAEEVKTADSESQQRTLQVALEKKYTTPFLPLIITLFTAPFALTLNRKGKVVTIAYAVGVWLLFMGITNTFEQFGISGFISPKIAAWGPLIIFTLIGSYFLTKIKT